MTLQDCYDYRRWAESMMQDARIKNSADEYWYLNTWCDKFDRLASNFTCWNDEHNVYKAGLQKLKMLARSL